MVRYQLTASIVTYKSNPEVLQKAIDSFLTNTLNTRLFIIDNSPVKSTGLNLDDPRCKYLFNNANLGFGKAHNIALKEVIDQSEYHLILNPDVSFPTNTLEQLYDFMELHPDVGLIMPRVVNDELQVQNNCKRLPSPLDLVIRRFGFFSLQKFFKKRMDFYEMQDKNYNEPFEVPYLSGCFMFFRTEALKKIGFFDDRFFMYMEDIDISRRTLQYYKNIYYPYAYIYHGHARESYRINKLLFVHMVSAIKYFSKWGWFFDPQRKLYNNRKDTFKKKAEASAVITAD